jgi:tRNA 2-thiouridine synthesizing protein D
MKFALLVSEGPYTHQASDTAFQFASAALAAGHEVMRVFFYHDGVYNATRLTEPPQDDRHIVNRWSSLKEKHGVDLVVCVAAALRRGIKDEVLAPGFRISGLGQLVDAGIKADRTVTFGD